MLNLLIAILGNTYSRIAQHEKVQMEYERARCIYEIERHFMPGFAMRLETFFPRFLHSLRPASAKGVGDDTMEQRLTENLNDQISLLKNELTHLTDHMNGQVSRMIMLLEPSTRVTRTDHPHPLRPVHMHLWGKTFPNGKWRCAACMQDFDKDEVAVQDKHELCFVCEDHYPTSKQTWHPSHRCAFALCSNCVRNEVLMSAQFLDQLQHHVEDTDDEDELIETDSDEYNDETDSSDEEYYEDEEED
jgi:hypothetical protein